MTERPNRPRTLLCRYLHEFQRHSPAAVEVGTVGGQADGFWLSRMSRADLRGVYHCRIVDRGLPAKKVSVALIDSDSAQYLGMHCWYV